MDPYLRGVPAERSGNLLTGYAAYVQAGHAGRGYQVQTGSVSAALCAVGKKFELVRLANPIYAEGTNKRYFAALERQIQSYKNKDPPSKPQYSVPVTLTEWLLQHDWTAKRPSPKRATTARLITVAFYYLLRVGEYTKPTKKHTRTVPFRTGDVTFRDKKGRVIPNTASLTALLKASEATIRIDNQKNGVRAQTIHQECNGKDTSPVKALAHQIHHILAHGGTATTGIYTYFDRRGRQHEIRQCDINKAIRTAAKAIGLLSEIGGYQETDVSSHSLRAGGALALHLANVSLQQIKIMGRWKSNTFETYIHEQISEFSAGISTKMAKHHQFRQIASPTVCNVGAAAA